MPHFTHRLRTGLAMAARAAMRARWVCQTATDAGSVLPIA